VSAPGPGTGPRRGALALYAVCRVIAVGASRLYLPGPVLGREHLPERGAYVLAPVHRSYLDWLVVARVTRRRLRYLVKGEVWRWRLLGRFLEALGAFPVRRDAADREAFNRALEVLRAGEPLVVFPEGTRRDGPVVGELRDGAAYLALRADVPLVPVGVAGAAEAMPRGARLPRPRRVAIVIAAPIRPDGQARGGRVSRSRTHELTAELRRALQEAFDAAERVRGGW